MKKLLIIVLLFSAVNGIAQTSLFDKDTLANNPVFKQRVKAATSIAANQNAAGVGDSAWIYAYANEIIRNPNGGWIDAMTFQVVDNPAISYNSSDGDIQFTVNSNFAKCAKAFTGYLPPGTPSQSNASLIGRIRN